MVSRRDTLRSAALYWISFFAVVSAIIWAAVTVTDLRHRLDESNAHRDALTKQVKKLKGVPVPGPDGKDGSHGSDGNDGRDGRDGNAGKDGAPGRAGSAGSNGKDGKAGAAGSQGPQGPEGKPGKDGVDGAQGPQGPKGDKGEQGDKGERGDTGSVVMTCPEGTDLQKFYVQTTEGPQLAAICVVIEGLFSEGR